MDPPTIGVNIAIFENGKLLLTQREDFEVWCLPGGGVDAGETAAQAAVREAAEETGLEVALTHLVGVYSRPGVGSFVGHIFLFAGEPIGGSLRTQPGETIDLRYFNQGELPELLLQGQLHRITDAWNKPGGSVAWRQGAEWPFEAGITYQRLYELRDQSGLSRQEFYDRFLAQKNLLGDFLEIPSPASSSTLEPLQLNAARFGNMSGVLHDKRETEPAIQQDRLSSLKPSIAADVAVCQDGKILLAKREDFHVWGIPGGRVEPAETLAAAARRELKEETGLDIVLDRFVGIYSEPRRFECGLHIASFSGHIVGGTMQPQAEEVLELVFFRLEELPKEMVYGHRQRVFDACSGIGGSEVWSQSMPWPFPPHFTRREIYDLRDRSGLSRSDFYFKHFRDPLPGEEVDELIQANPI